MSLHWMRKLRALDTAATAARKRLDTVRALADSTPDPVQFTADIAPLEQAHEAAEALFQAHGQTDPDLFNEYLARLELAETLAALQRAERTHERIARTLGALPPLDPPPTGPQYRANLAEQAAVAARALVNSQTAIAYELDAEFQALASSDGDNWLQLRQLEERAHYAGAEARRLTEIAERREASAAHARRQATRSTERYDAQVADRARQAAELPLLADQIAAHRARATHLAESLPHPPRAPLRETRNTYTPRGSEVSLSEAGAEHRGTVRAKYGYDQINDRLYRKADGHTLTSETVQVNGARLSRRRIIGMLMGPHRPLSARELATILPGDLA